MCRDIFFCFVGEQQNDWITLILHLCIFIFLIVSHLIKTWTKSTSSLKWFSQFELLILILFRQIYRFLCNLNVVYSLCMMAKIKWLHWQHLWLCVILINVFVHYSVLRDSNRFRSTSHDPVVCLSLLTQCIVLNIMCQFTEDLQTSP